MQELLPEVREDELQFHFSNKTLPGPYWELLFLYAAELRNLLGLAEQMDEDQRQ